MDESAQLQNQIEEFEKKQEWWWAAEKQRSQRLDYLRKAVWKKGAIGGMGKNGNPPWVVAIDPIFEREILADGFAQRRRVGSQQRQGVPFLSPPLVDGILPSQRPAVDHARKGGQPVVVRLAAEDRGHRRAPAGRADLRDQSPARQRCVVVVGRQEDVLWLLQGHRCAV